MNDERSGFDAAIKYLSYAGRTEKEMSTYLIKKGYSEEQITSVLEKLKDYKFVDDEIYATSFINSNKLKKKSRREIEFKMKAKGLSGDVIQNTIEEGYSYEEELESAISILDKYYRRYESRETPNIEFKVKQAVYQKGYSYEIVNEAYNQYLQRRDT